MAGINFAVTMRHNGAFSSFSDRAGMSTGFNWARGFMMKKKMPNNLRNRLLMLTALSVAGTGLALAQSATAPGPAPVSGPTGTSGPVVVPGEGTTSDMDSYQIQKVRIIYHRLLLKEKDIPNATSVIKPKDIQAANPTQGSIQTLLNRTPSVVAYTQGPGQSAPTLAIRGVRNDELAETLDGIPINDILSGSGDYLTNNVSSPVTLNEIDGVTIYPGVAPPDHQGFNTVGGTIAYTTKQPTDDRYAELEGGIGSFDTQHFGFVLNSGKLGDGVDAPKVLMLYDQSQTAGYVSNTNAQYHDFMLNAVKPYDNGLSKVGLVIIFNQGRGAIQTTPTPIAEIQANKFTYNFPKSLGFYNQSGQFLTTILSDETYINQYMIFDGSLFYLHQTDAIDSYSAAATATGAFPYAVNVQAPYNFFGCVGPASPFYSPGYFTYTPDQTSDNSCAEGESSEYTTNHYNTIGITPKLNIFVPEIAGINNTVTVGGLLAKESSGGNQYLYGGTAAQFNQINGYDSFGLGGGQQRTVYVAYIQDKISLLNDKLQITPGLRVNAAYSSRIQQVEYGIYNPGKFQNFTKIGEPYLGIAYNLPAHFVVYGSYGKGSLFSPTADYSEGTTPTGLPGGTQAPTPEVVHLYEAGIRYDTPQLYLNLDYFYQKVNDAFSFYTDYLTNSQFYANTGAFLARGVEANGEVQVTPAISVFANGSYNNTDYLNSYFAFDTLQEDQFGYAFKGSPISNVPTWTGNIGVDYDQGPFSGRISGQYTGREFTTEDLLTPSDPTSTLSGATITDTQIKNPANFVVNLLASYTIPIQSHHIQSLNITFTALNIFQKHYYTYTYSSETANAGVYSINPPFNSALIGPPRSLQLDLTAKF